MRSIPSKSSKTNIAKSQTTFGTTHLNVSGNNRVFRQTENELEDEREERKIDSDRSSARIKVLQEEISDLQADNHELATGKFFFSHVLTFLRVAKS
jgi:hypothetical protein